MAFAPAALSSPVNLNHSRFKVNATSCKASKLVAHSAAFSRGGALRVGISNSNRLQDRGRRCHRRSTIEVVDAIGVFFGSVTGHTGEMADSLIDALGEAEPVDVGDIDSAADLSAFDALIVGVPTWHTGADTERSGTAWDSFIDDIKGMDSLKGKPCAVFGCGDSVGYSDNFCDAIEEVHDAFEGAGCKMIGYTDPSTYDFGESKSVRDGKFLGLPLDYENEYDECADRIDKWVAQIRTEMA